MFPVQDLQKKWKSLKRYYDNVQSKKHRGSVSLIKHLSLLTFLHPNIDKSPLSTNTKKAIIQVEKKKTPHHANLQTETICILPENNCVNPPTISEPQQMAEVDPDESFLMSLLPDVITMSEKQKFQFKLGIMNLIGSAKHMNNATTSISEHNDINQQEVFGKGLNCEIQPELIIAKIEKDLQENTFHNE